MFASRFASTAARGLRTARTRTRINRTPTPNSIVTPHLALASRRMMSSGPQQRGNGGRELLAFMMDVPKDVYPVVVMVAFACACGIYAMGTHLTRGDLRIRPSHMKAEETA